MAATAFFDTNGKARLVPSYCVFADILGYRNEIKKAIADGKEDEIFQNFMADVEPEIKRIIQPGPYDEITGRPRMWDAKVFTNNIVLGYAIWSGHGENEFGAVVDQLLRFQFATAMKGIFMRGGWAIGNLFMNRNTVYGGALLESYDLESKEAIYPRIILSEEMKEVVFRHMAFYGNHSPQSHHLLMDSEGRLFTNYLTEAIGNDQIYWDSISIHAKIISSRLKMYRNNNRVFEKYQWLAAYNNFFCNQYSRDNESVKVSGDFPDYGIRILRHEDSPNVLAAQEERKKHNEHLEKLKPRRGDSK